MQTFLPYSDFDKSAQCLDNKRLVKQNIECLQILNTLTLGPYCKRAKGGVLKGIGPLEPATKEEFEKPERLGFSYFDCKKTPWYNHPAVLMWKGYIRVLLYYGLAINEECVKRGYKNKEHDYLKYIKYCSQFNLGEVYPSWLGNEAFHSSHRSRLICKGVIDSFCDALKQRLKIKKIDDFIKKEFGKTKNALVWADTKLLQVLVVEHGASGLLKNSHYSKFDWTDDESKPYIWPTKHI